jgi:cell wall-associated NlpC family hydrolase
MTGDDLAAAALALVGVPFRLHGRDPATGLDCVGVLAAALGRPGALPNGYALRHHTPPELSGPFAALGMAPAAGPARPGDVLVLTPGPCQLHLAIAAGGGSIVHAHAGLRKVVRGPLPAPWPCLSHWRLPSSRQGVPDGDARIQ